MKEVSLTEILHTLDIWWAEANNDHNDGYVQKGFKDKLDVIRKNLDTKKSSIKLEETKEEMCF
jgi:DNA mismatch repair ATPase MutS